MSQEEWGVSWLHTACIMLTMIGCTIFILNHIDKKAKVQMESTQNISYYLSKLLEDKEFYK